jgi:hypothetical protein
MTEPDREMNNAPRELDPRRMSYLHHMMQEAVWELKQARVRKNQLAGGWKEGWAGTWSAGGGEEKTTRQNGMLRGKEWGR